jgi:hypothetical protein
MNDVFVTCIKNGRVDSFGIPLIAGTYYPAVEINTANALWNAGYVSVADASVFDQDPLSGTSPLDDFNVARSIAISRQPIETAANLAAELRQPWPLIMKWSILELPCQQPSLLFQVVRQEVTGFGGIAWHRLLRLVPMMSGS